MTLELKEIPEKKERLGFVDQLDHVDPKDPLVIQEHLVYQALL